MRKFILVLSGVAMAIQIEAQQKKFNLWEYLGLVGNTYRTEVYIPIGQIRYQGTERLPKVQKYSAKAGEGLPTPMPTISADLVYSLYTEPTTAVPLIKVKPCVRFMATKTPFVPSAGNPFPPAGATLEICACNDPGVIESKEYFFIPAEGKMPNFAQLLRDELFISGPFAVMFRFRGKVSPMDDLPELGTEFGTGVSLGVVIGAKHSFGNANNYGRVYKIPVTYQFPILMLGANTVEVKRRKDTDNNGKFDAYTDKESRVALTLGTGFGLQVWKIGFMPLVGWDFLLGNENKTWPYHGRPWMGISVGISLEKLVELSK